MSNYSIPDTESIILQNIYESVEKKTEIRQRDLARVAGISLGMTNSILQRLIQKGWVQVKKIKRRNIQYAVTIDGMNEIIKRSYGYFKRTIKNVVYYKETLDSIIRKAQQKKINAVILAGVSDLDFIVEHTCQKYGISFLKTAEPESIKKTANTLYIYSETISSITIEDNSGNSGDNKLYLSSLLLTQRNNSD